MPPCHRGMPWCVFQLSLSCQQCTQIPENRSQTHLLFKMLLPLSLSCSVQTQFKQWCTKCDYSLGLIFFMGWLFWWVGSGSRLDKWKATDNQHWEDLSLSLVTVSERQSLPLAALQLQLFCTELPTLNCLSQWKSGSHHHPLDRFLRCIFTSYKVCINQQFLSFY